METVDDIISDMAAHPLSPETRDFARRLRCAREREVAREVDANTCHIMGVAGPVSLAASEDPNGCTITLHESDGRVINIGLSEWKEMEKLRDAVVQYRRDMLRAELSMESQAKAIRELIDHSNELLDNAGIPRTANGILTWWYRVELACNKIAELRAENYDGRG